MQRVMATEAESAREAKAAVISSEGEKNASKALKEAADILSKSPMALQLRYLQTLTDLTNENGSTILFPIPMDMLSLLPKFNKNVQLADNFINEFDDNQKNIDGRLSKIKLDIHDNHNIAKSRAHSGQTVVQTNSFKLNQARPISKK
jgi:erythrocyte band 7 integral membrane protein